MYTKAFDCEVSDVFLEDFATRLLQFSTFFSCRQSVLAFLMTTSSNCYPVVKATAWKSSELNCRVRKQRTEEVRPFELLFDGIWISSL